MLRCLVIPATLLLLVAARPGDRSEPAKMTIWADAPARDWAKNAYPLGNGNLGCMVFGDPAKERMQFNQDTLWVGSEKDTGCYQTFGDIQVTFPHAKYSDYRRELDISRAVHTITYKADGVSYKREYFSSRPANVMVFRYTADKDKSLSGSVKLVDSHGGKVTAEKNRITISGDLSNHQFYRKKNRTWENPIVLDYEAQLLVQNEGGKLGTEGETLAFSDCDSVTIFVAAGTNYLNQRDKGWKGEHPHKRITSDIDGAAKQDYAKLLSAHISDYQSLYNRLSIELGTTEAGIASLPTGGRLASYKEGKPDPDLEELLFQHARYLMISSSRPGTMPANLQGLWNTSNGPPWRCDYHSDVNVQMNYWFVDQANLSECYRPLPEWFFSIREVRRDETKAHFNKRGFAMHAENGIFGGSTWKWSIGDASWVMNNLYAHYEFTLDTDYLKTRAYPIMKDLFMFWEDHLKEIPAPSGKGSVLVAPDGFSPEHGPHEDGVSFDQQLCWDLLSNFIRASEILGVDKEEREKAVKMRDSLLGPQIGKWGQLQEWMVDRDDPKDKHRHLSHMIALHPGRQISPVTTPKLAEAARVSINARGDGGTGWSKSWKISFWARLHDGNRAYKLLGELICNNIYDNLYDTHPPFQIDGNFGYGSGVCEMLLQSHMGFIHLLPALPDKWSDGEVRGMRVRGDAEADLKWAGGKLVSLTLKAGKNYQAMPLVYGDKKISVNLKPGEKKTFTATDFK